MNPLRRARRALPPRHNMNLQLTGESVFHLSDPTAAFITSVLLSGGSAVALGSAALTNGT